LILPDVNVLIHAFRKDSSEHRVCKSWLERVVNGDSRFGIATSVLSGVIRVVTTPRAFNTPSETSDALEFCERLIESPNSFIVQPGERHWELFTSLCREVEARGKLVPDAWFAALAIESGCEWITFDRDYSRFPGLRWRTPG